MFGTDALSGTAPDSGYGLASTYLFETLSSSVSDVPIRAMSPRTNHFSGYFPVYWEPKNSLLPCGFGLMVALPSCQLAGHTSPCVSTNCRALTRRSASSTLRPNGRSLTTCGAPRRSGRSGTDHAGRSGGQQDVVGLADPLVQIRDQRILDLANAAVGTGVFRQARCENWLSIDTPSTWTLAWRNPSRDPRRQ